MRPQYITAVVLSSFLIGGIPAEAWPGAGGDHGGSLVRLEGRARRAPRCAPLKSRHGAEELEQFPAISRWDARRMARLDVHAGHANALSGPRNAVQCCRRPADNRASNKSQKARPLSQRARRRLAEI